MKFLKSFWHLFKNTANEWSQDKAPRLGAALAFYSMLSIGPLLLITVAVVGAFYGEDAARGQITSQISGLVGMDGGKAIEQLIASSRQADTNLWAGIIGTVTLLVSASGVFGELQDAMNTIWGVQASGNGIAGAIKNRFFSFAMVLAIGLLLLMSLVITAVLAGISTFVKSLLPAFASLLFVLDFAVTLGVISLLFALIFKVIPDVRLQWRDVRGAAILTGVFFTAGKFLIGIYLGHSGIASTYGAAGSFIVLLVWIYYSAQILYFGAEFSKVYTRTLGSMAKKPMES